MIYAMCVRWHVWPAEHDATIPAGRGRKDGQHVWHGREIAPALYKPCRLIQIIVMLLFVSKKSVFGRMSV